MTGATTSHVGHSRRSTPRRPGAAGRAATVEVEPRVVDLEPISRAAPGDGGDVGLVDLLDPAAARAGDVVVVRRQAGDVRVDVAIELEAACHAGIHQRLEGAEDGRATDPRLAPPQAA